jgi:ribonuclease P protein component
LIQDADHEAHISAEQPGAQAPPWLLRPQGDPGRPQGPARAPPAWPQVALRLSQAHDSTTIAVIKRRADFLAANKGLRVARPGFVLLARPNGGLGKRFGITVTKKIGNAVVRNRMKRRFRELLRASLPQQGLPDHDHVLIGREGGVERDFATMQAELAAALARASAGKGDPPRRRTPRRR